MSRSRHSRTASLAQTWSAQPWMASPWAASPPSCLQTKFQRPQKTFHALSAGEEGSGSKGSCFHGIIPGSVCQDGDVTCHHGIGSKSIYGEKFEDGNFILKHTGPGIRSVANTGPDNKRVPSFASALPRLSVWTASLWSLARWKRTWILREPWNALGPGKARAARRSPLLTAFLLLAPLQV